jgi:uncharacterized protein YutE (UPF0331/DUF86 family)
MLPMPRYDADRVLKLVSTMRDAVGHLNRHRESAKDEFLADPDKIAGAKYFLIVAIDICNHLISKNGWRVPEDYADSFKVMGEAGAFSRDDVEALQTMARFRNRLVHIYWEVDSEQVFRLIETRLGDFGKFLDDMARFLGWKDLG